MSEENRQAAMKVIEILHEAGFQGLWAGGCVRDMLMGVEPQDYDIATDAYPEQVGKLFRRTLMVGAQFGVVVVLIGNVQIEVATFRSEGGYADGRRPDSIEFTDAKEDALRRDFTINGMFYDPIADEVLDYVGGRHDLEGRVIRAIGDAEARFGEDHLRMLRAVRFAARLGYVIESKTWQAICKHRMRISMISAERVAMELEKILVHESRHTGMRLLADCGLMKYIFPWCSPECHEEGIELLKYIRGEVDLGLGLAMILIAEEVEDVGQICRELKLSNDVRKKGHWLAAGMAKLAGDMPLSKGRLKRWLANEWFGDLRRLMRARNEQLGESNEAMDRLAEQIEELGDEEITPVPILNGNDLMALGIKPGPGLGAMFDKVYLAQLEGEIVDKGQAEEMVRKCKVQSAKCEDGEV